MVARMFKGLSSSGAWCCFDEFNRINIEVLSVIAQQLQFLFEKKARGETHATFEGSEIKVLPTFSVFITMNPGYAGRTELPGNLKALFRPVVMAVPDLELICEIMLFSEGFTKAKSLAKKMVVLYRLAKGQLSKQHHYDFGLRNILSVLRTLGTVKRANPNDRYDVDKRVVQLEIETREPLSDEFYDALSSPVQVLAVRPFDEEFNTPHPTIPTYAADVQPLRTNNPLRYCKMDYVSSLLFVR